MRDEFRRLLFKKHILVAPLVEDVPYSDSGEAFSTVVALARRFGIRIVEGADKACPSLVADAGMFLGEYVPEPFYRGFPKTVRELTSNQLLFDQLYHYTKTYGLGWTNEAGHSVIEEAYDNFGFGFRIGDEQAEPRDFKIVCLTKAEEEVQTIIRDILSTNRPLNIDQWMTVSAAWETYGKSILPKTIPCKDTVVKLLYTYKDLHFCNYLVLSDVIKLLAFIQASVYGSENIKKLNLCNKDRKFITDVINWFAIRSADYPCCDYTVCFEKRKIWCGLFHHIHYRVPNDKPCGYMNMFIKDVRSNVNHSAYHFFEEAMRNGDRARAATVLREMKGNSDVIRHLDYILSRCDNEHEVREVLKCLQ